MNLIWSIAVAITFFALTSGSMKYVFDVDRESLWYLIPFALSVVILFVTYELRRREVVIQEMTLRGMLAITTSVILHLANFLGILVYVPLLIAVGMALGAPGAGKNWSDWLIPIASVMLGPLCIAGARSTKRPHLGLVGFAILGVAIGLSVMLFGD